MAKRIDKYVLNALKQIDEIGFAAGYEQHRHRVHRLRANSYLDILALGLSSIRWYYSGRKYDKAVRCVRIEHVIVFSFKFFAPFNVCISFLVGECSAKPKVHRCPDVCRSALLAGLQSA